MRDAFRKTPVVLQTGPADCGAACLAMVLAAHGTLVPLPRIKKRLRIPRTKGVDAWKLLKCAASYGLPGEGVAGGPRALRRLALPAILHWRENHFVVLVRWKANGAAEIIDPASGRRTVGVRKFALEFSGTALRFRQVAKAHHGGTESQRKAKKNCR